MHLVIVESPTKAKTIRKFLGPEYKVLASMGHVRDLPESSSEIPAAYKKTPWGQLGVNVEQDFEPLYVIPKRKSKTVSELKAALKEADVLYLATDEDREGESISWHLLQLLKPKVPVHRMVFHEITKQAIQSALEHPRELDERLVRAQETRRILDRLVGYTISPILWKKIAYGLSAGRVQSSALKAIVDRERARIAFKTSSYWDVVADVEAKDGSCEAKLISVGGND
jgi:DNA topoisomerase-1